MKHTRPARSRCNAVASAILLATAASAIAAPPRDRIVLLPLEAHDGSIAPERTKNHPWVLESVGDARAAFADAPARENGTRFEWCDGRVITLPASGSEMRGARWMLESRTGGEIRLAPGATFEVGINVGLAAGSHGELRAFLVNASGATLARSTRVPVDADQGVDGWKRAAFRLRMPKAVDPNGVSIRFANVAPVDSGSTLMIDEASIARVSADETGFTSLFDGESLRGWRGALDAYEVHEGTIRIPPDVSSYGNLYTEGEFGDFTLRFEFLLEPGTNNGIGVRTPLEGDAAYVGMEIQVLENSADRWAGLKEWQYHGGVYGVSPSLRGYQLGPGTWNVQEIEVRGRTVRVTLNGKVITDVDLDDAIRGGLPSGQRHPGLQRTTGHIAFCGHGDPVAFRNLRIRVLD